MKRLKILNVSVRYKRKVVVSDVSLSVDPGKTLGLVGESGSGKSTLANAIVGLSSVDSGDVVVGEQSLLGRSKGAVSARRSIQLIFQDPFSSLNPRMSVGDSIGEAMYATGSKWRQRDRKTRVTELMEQVGLNPSRFNDRPNMFSGGQRQRVTIARALAAEPQVIIADEVTSALDVSIQGSVLNLLKAVQSRFGISIIFISHNLAVTRYMSDDIAVMKQGSVVEMNSTESLLEFPETAYTKELIRSVPTFGQKFGDDEGAV